MSPDASGDPSDEEDSGETQLLLEAPFQHDGPIVGIRVTLPGA